MLNVSPSPSLERQGCLMYLHRPSPGDTDAQCIFVVQSGETGMPDVSSSSIPGRRRCSMYLRRPVWRDRDASNNYFISAPPVSALVEEKLQGVENCICLTPGGPAIYGSL